MTDKDANDFSGMTLALCLFFPPLIPIAIILWTIGLFLEWLDKTD